MGFISYNEYDEQELLGLISRDDDLAFKEVYNRYWNKLVSYAFSILNEEEVCKDILQEIFIRLWQRRREVSIFSLNGYLFRAVKLKVLEHMRNGYITNRHLKQLDKICFANNVEQEMSLKEVESRFKASVAKLPGRCQEIFCLSRFENLPNKEIANRLSISVKTVEGHITAALKHLYKDLGEFVSVGLWWIILNS